MCLPGCVALLGRGVLPVVASQVQIGEVDQRVSPVVLGLTEPGPQAGLGSPEVGLVVVVRLGWPRAESGEACYHPGW